MIVYILLLVYACKEQDYMYLEYIIEGGVTYPGKAKDAVIRPGRETVEISWLNIDTSVKKAVIYWNLYADSVTVEIPVGTDTVRTLVNVPEGQYSFFIKTFDSKGNASIPIELTCKVYGPKYESGLANREILTASMSGNTVTVTWGGAFNDELGINLFYTDVSGENVTLFIPSEEATSTVIDDLNPSYTVMYQTLYLPDPRALDTIIMPTVKVPIIIKLDKSKWKRYELPSDWIEPNSNEGMGHCTIEHAWDGITTDQYSNIFSCNATPFPMTFTIDLGTRAIISNFKLWQWHGLAYQYHNMKIFELYGSGIDAPDDNLYGGDWVLLGRFNDIRPEDYNYILSVADNVPVRYVRFKVFETYINSSAGVVVVPELEFYGK